MNVQKIIKQKGYTVAQVAQQMPNSKDSDNIGISQGSLSTMLNNNPTVNTLRNIAKIIGCDITDFFLDETKDKCSTTCETKCPYCGKNLKIEIS